MVNGLGVLGWGVGGIEAEAAMLGQAASMLIPQVVGVRFTGKLREGSTATDLVLTVTEALRKKGVVGKFVEYFGPSLGTLTAADRATIANMGPEYGATCGIFPVDEETLRYLRLTGRSEEQIALVEAYFKEQGMFHTAASPEAEYTDVLHIDLSKIEPSIAGPKRPQDRVELSRALTSFAEALPSLLKPGAKSGATVPAGRADRNSKDYSTALHHGSVVLAAITSCTNTSNPVCAGGGRSGGQEGGGKGAEASRVGEDLAGAGLEGGDRVSGGGGIAELSRRPGLQPGGLWLHHLHRQLGTAAAGPVSDEIGSQDLVVASVLSGNRNFEGRISPEIRANYLMSPPLVVAFALAGELIDMHQRPDRHRVEWAGVSQGHLADAAGSGRGGGAGDHLGDVPHELCDRAGWRCALAGAEGSGGRYVCVGRQVHLHSESSVL